jgi:NAD(P)-dependent dehydrogenase (short-subunit alcohol dehydrogenase family)
MDGTRMNGIHSLTHKRVFITGASRGLGRAVAEAFAREGAELALTATAAAHLTPVLDTCRALGTRAEGFALELGDELSVSEVVAAVVERFGSVDVLVNNAAVLGGHGPLRHFSRAQLATVMHVDVLGPLSMIRLLVPYMPRGAVVVNVTSSAAGRSGSGPYGLAKLALDGATRMLQEELADLDIFCVAIDPGAMRTDMRAEAKPDEDPATVPEPATRVRAFLDVARGAETGWLVRAYE